MKKKANRLDAIKMHLLKEGKIEIGENRIEYRKEK